MVNKVIILGAGASFGSALQSRPPIMRDFIKLGRAICQSDYSDLWKLLDVLGYKLKDLESGNPNLEVIFSILDIISTGLWYEDEKSFIEDVGPKFWKFTPVKFLESFIVEVTAKASMEALQNTCRYHDSLIRQLNDGECVISLNYDLIADASFRKSGKWNEAYGYGFPDFDLIAKDHHEESPTFLLKPHGSLNWKTQIDLERHATKQFSWKYFHENLNPNESESYVKLSVNRLSELDEQYFDHSSIIETAEFWNQLRSKVSEENLYKVVGIESNKRKNFIIPPTVYKFGEAKLPVQLVKVWAKMKTAIELAREIVIIGYSFPETDLHLTTLFRQVLSKGKKVLKFVDISDGPCKRIKVQFPNCEVSHIATSFKDYIDRYA